MNAYSTHVFTWNFHWNRKVLQGIVTRLSKSDRKLT